MELVCRGSSVILIQNVPGAQNKTNGFCNKRLEVETEGLVIEPTWLRCISMQPNESDKWLLVIYEDGPLQVLVCLHIFSLCASAHPASPPPPAFSLLKNAELNTPILLNLTHALKSVHLLDPTAHKEPTNFKIIANTTNSALPQDPSITIPPLLYQ